MSIEKRVVLFSRSFRTLMRVFHKSFNVAGTGSRATVEKRRPFT